MTGTSIAPANPSSAAALSRPRAAERDAPPDGQLLPGPARAYSVPRARWPAPVHPACALRRPRPGAFRQDRMNGLDRSAVGCDCNCRTLESIQNAGFTVTRVEHATMPKVPSLPARPSWAAPRFPRRCRPRTPGPAAETGHDHHDRKVPPLASGTTGRQPGGTRFSDWGSAGPGRLTGPLPALKALSSASGLEGAHQAVLGGVERRRGAA